MPLEPARRAPAISRVVAASSRRNGCSSHPTPAAGHRAGGGFVYAIVSTKRNSTFWSHSPYLMLRAVAAFIREYRSELCRQSFGTTRQKQPFHRRHGSPRKTTPYNFQRNIGPHPTIRRF